MPRATRSSAKSGSSDPSAADMSPDAGTRKRKAEASTTPQSKRGKKAKQDDGGKEQKTLEQTMPGVEDNAEDVNGGGVADQEMKDVGDKVEAEDAEDAQKQAGEQMNGHAKENGRIEEKADDESEGRKGEKASAEVKANGETSSGEDGHEDTEKLLSKDDASKIDSTGHVSKDEDSSKDAPQPDTTDGAIESSQSRGDAAPRNILEKGLLYFFIRPRVGTDSAGGVTDIARTYIVLRPLPSDAKLTDGPINDLKNNRLLALPKKVLPRSHKDIFMTFVEKAGVSIEQLKEDFFKGSTYDTKTVGVRHSPPVTPVGEGVYCITTTGRESHLAYMLTIPKELGPVQEEIGLAPQGSFVLSVKNPEASGPAGTSLPQGPGFPEEMMEDFGGLRWTPLQPKHLDYVNAQFLLIGEGHGDVEKATVADERDEKDDEKETAHEEMEKLEAEDAQRVEGLKGDDSVFLDLGISKKEFPDVQTTW